MVMNSRNKNNNDVASLTLFNKIVAVVLLSLFICLPSSPRSNTSIYKSDDFGYIILDRHAHTADIFKYIDGLKTNLEWIASCDIVKERNDHFIVSSKTNYWDIFPDTDVTVSHGSHSDSINIELVVPAELNDKYILTYNTGNGNKYVKLYLNREGITNFKIGKDVPTRDIILYIYKDIQPFRMYSSFGDSMTYSYMVIIPGEHIDFKGDDISSIHIVLPNFDDSLFKKWVIKKAYILKINNNLYWNGYEFHIEKKSNLPHPMYLKNNNHPQTGLPLYDYIP